MNVEWFRYPKAEELVAKNGKMAKWVCLLASRAYRGSHPYPFQLPSQGFLDWRRACNS